MGTDDHALAKRLAELGIRGKGKKAFKAFQNYLLNACPELRYCQIIATSAKHLSYELRPEDPTFETNTAPAQITWVNNQGEPVYFVNDKNKPITWTSQAWDLCIFEGETRRRAFDVFTGALTWWRQFLKEGIDG
jgi:hypothetical protein